MAMVGALEANGDNTTPLKHMQKAKKRKEGTLPIVIQCPAIAIAKSRKWYDENRWVLTKREDDKKAKLEKEALDKAER